ncbi:ubiquinone biosynthesis protein [Virgibacillus campisalis]|uniref:Ubiquinone biosynthesis protein n=1 Tax=Virgibacillus alimentarius TaxID=698769 RepID=A0ABS4S9J0_9BACI|nr:ubiquinone biosynthesis protein [Virgibacillus alimentarius]
MKRYREIAVAFSKNGFGYMVRELGLHELIPLPRRFSVKRSQKHHAKTIGERIRLFLEELGPTFVKLGQFASTRSDLIPDHIIQELEKLQDQVPANEAKEMKEVIEKELKMPIEQIFSQFHDEPLGAASIGQVHYAVLQTGEAVAVKVQRPNIKKNIKTDLEILKQLAVMAEHRLEWAKRYQIENMVDEFAKALLHELDYTVEGRNADRIAKQFTDDPNIHIPTIYWDYTTRNVLIMEYVAGTKLNQMDQLQQAGYDTKILAKRITNAIFHQIFIEGFFHGDPHPGNISALPGEKVVLMDFGMMGRLTRDMKKNFSTLVISMMRQHTEGVIKAITRMGMVPDDVNMEQLRADIDDLREKYYDVPLRQVSIGSAVDDLLQVSHKHQIHIPADLTLLGKTLATLESMVVKLDPEISIIKLAEPFGRQLLFERFRPKNIAENVVNEWSEVSETLADVPETIRDLKTMIKQKKLPIELSFSKAENFLNKLDRISNRISFSIVLLSFSIIMVGLIIGSALGGQSSILWDIPAIEIGFVVALLMFLWLLFSIFRSGRF